ncbi:MAG: hypothetical protein HOE53_00005 [Candidatus Magasanikbacteria bacterium]|nr:hypothetical protein [Candidatus Magasanikbacteria bacterium]
MGANGRKDVTEQQLIQFLALLSAKTTEMGGEYIRAINGVLREIDRLCFGAKRLLREGVRCVGGLTIALSQHQKVQEAMSAQGKSDSIIPDDIKMAETALTIHFVGSKQGIIKLDMSEAAKIAEILAPAVVEVVAVAAREFNQAQA